MAALTTVWADRMNGKPAPDFQSVVAGMASLWNEYSAGPLQMLWVPFFSEANLFPLFSPTLGGGMFETPAPAGVEYGAFGTPTDVGLARWAFQPYEVAAAAGMAPYGFGVQVNAGAFVAPRTIKLNLAGLSKLRLPMTTGKAMPKTIKLNLTGISKLDFSGLTAAQSSTIEQFKVAPPATDSTKPLFTVGGHTVTRKQAGIGAAIGGGLLALKFLL